MPWAPISASHSSPSSSAFALLITTTAQAPSEIWDAEPAVIVPSLRNAGRRAESDSMVVSPRTPSSALITTGSPLRCGIETGTTSSSKTPFFQASAAFWCEAAANGVLLLAGQGGVRGVVVLGQRAHRLLGGLVVERVVGHRVDQRGVAVLEALARLRQQVGRVRHRLHAAGHDDVGLTGVDQEVGLGDRVQPGQAHLVDRDRRDRERQAAGDARAAGRVLPGAGQDDLAHDQVVDLVGRHPGLLQRPLDGHAAQVGRGQGLQAAEQTPDRRTCSGDDDGSGHGASSQGSGDSGDDTQRPTGAARPEPGGTAEENLTAGRSPCGRLRDVRRWGHDPRRPRPPVHRDRPRRDRGRRPRRRHGVLPRHLRHGDRARGDQRGAGRPGGDGGGRRLGQLHPAARARSTSRPRSRSSWSAAARACSSSPTGSPTSRRCRRSCASAASACCTTLPGVERPARWSTSSTPRTPAASSWSWWSRRLAV